jgi:hypothetical protein
MRLRINQIIWYNNKVVEVEATRTRVHSVLPISDTSDDIAQLLIIISMDGEPTPNTQPQPLIEVLNHSL